MPDSFSPPRWLAHTRTAGKQTIQLVRVHDTQVRYDVFIKDCYLGSRIMKSITRIYAHDELDKICDAGEEMNDLFIEPSIAGLSLELYKEAIDTSIRFNRPNRPRFDELHSTSTKELL